LLLVWPAQVADAEREITAYSKALEELAQHPVEALEQVPVCQEKR